MEVRKNLNKDTIMSRLEKLKVDQRQARENPGFWLLFPAALNLAMGLTMVAIGAVHHRECVGNDATLFLIVAGGVQIFASSAKLLAYLTRIELLKKIESTGLLDLGYFAVVIWGAVKIFGSYPAWKANESLCPPSAFNFAFGSIIGFLIIFPLACCGFVVFAICCGRSAEESISDAA